MEQQLDRKKEETTGPLDTHLDDSSSEKRDSDTPEKSKKDIKTRMKVAAAVLGLASLLVFGSFWENHSAITGNLGQAGLDDDRAMHLVMTQYGRNYSEPIKLFQDRQTYLKIWDIGTVDGDIVSVNGVRFTLPGPAKPTLLTVPAGVGTAGVTFNGISQGRLHGITLGVLSEAGSMTYVVLSEGESLLVPTVL
ncbi:MAG: hypothetical protein ACYC69_02665 [Thermodesulfovibrionales bacterium]